MRILITYQGIYGERISRHIKESMPADWEIYSWQPPRLALPVIDDPEEFVPANLPPVDLILHLCETAQAAELIPAIVKITGASGVVASVDHAHWIPSGLRQQLQHDLKEMGCDIVFQEPLCSLTEHTYGYGHKQKHYQSEIISDFAHHYGWPQLKIVIDDDGNIASARVVRGAPCGSSQYTCGRIIGLQAHESIPTAGLLCLHYPCLASMQFEYTEDGIDTIMHTCGKVFNEALARALTDIKVKQ